MLYCNSEELESLHSAYREGQTQAALAAAADGGIGTVLKSLMCSLAGHSIDRKRVWHDGHSFRAKCQSCGTPMIRDRKGWREFDFEHDASGNRLPHPVTGEVA